MSTMSQAPTPPPPNIQEVLAYLDRVKARFNGEPDTYVQFVDILRDYGGCRDTSDVTRRIRCLFAAHVDLASEFDRFLPASMPASMASAPPIGARQARATSTPALPVRPLSMSPMQISQALEFVATIRRRFNRNPNVYQEFIDTVASLRDPRTTEAQIRSGHCRLNHLFQGHGDLLRGLQFFLPQSSPRFKAAARVKQQLLKTLR